MLTVCIPIYNYDISSLVEALHRQLVASGVPFEILCIDDASLPEFREQNRCLDLSNTKYIALEQNIGRSKIRNLLAREARYPYLIFMDCDSAIPSGDYITQYINTCRPGIVCYGGCMYDSELKDISFSLRWKYGRRRESLPAGQRAKHPNRGFRTNNFLIDKSIFDAVAFNEAITAYGHEDTVFGLDLAAHGFEVTHIDNPLIHIGLEDNRTFLKKTDAGLVNLHRIERLQEGRGAGLTNSFRIIRTKNLLTTLRLQKLLSVVFKLFRPILIRQLTGRRPSLLLFDLYRLGYFCSLY
jgi:glycosyltransferase involved in cell wall biosynthesis